MNIKTKLRFLFLNLLFLFSFLINTSCASFKDTEQNKNRIKLSEQNINEIKGKYLNNTKEKILPLNYFWGVNYKMQEYQSVYNLVYEQNVPYHIDIDVIKSNMLKITIIVDNEVLKTFNIKGKFKDGYFEQRGKFFVIPLLIFNVYHNSKFRIGLLENGNIITDYHQKEFATYVLTFKNTSENKNNIEHYRIDE